MRCLSRGFLMLVARLCICAIFLVSAIGNKIPHFSQVVTTMREKEIPFPRVALVLAIILLVLGSLSVVIGFKARVGALMLLIFLVPATVYFHDFWNMNDASTGLQQIMFMKNLSLAGTMLMISLLGAGPWSIDACRATDNSCSVQKTDAGS